MKIWNSFSCDHSSKLKIVGQFTSVDDAKKAAEAFNSILEVEKKMNGNRFTDEAMEVMKKYNISIWDHHDMEYLDCFDKIEADGDTITIKTDEYSIDPIVKLMITYSAKINIVSRHSHPDEY